MKTDSMSYNLDEGSSNLFQAGNFGIHFAVAEAMEAGIH